MFKVNDAPGSVVAVDELTELMFDVSIRVSLVHEQQTIREGKREFFIRLNRPGETFFF